MTTEATAVNEGASAAAEQAAAEASFARSMGEEATPQVEPEVIEQVAPEVDKEAEAARIKAQEEEWLKGAPQSVRDGLSAISSLGTRLRNVEGHIGGLNGQMKEVRSTLAAAKTAATEAGAPSPTDAQVAAANTSEKWKQMKEDFPEWADAIEERLSASRGPSFHPDDIRKMVLETINPDEIKAQAREYARLDAKYEGWEDTVATPDFLAWYQTQPSEIHALGDSMKAADAIKILDAYTRSKSSTPANEPATSHANTPANTQRDRLERAVTPTKAQTPAPPQAGLSEEEAAAAAFARNRRGG